MYYDQHDQQVLRKYAKTSYFSSKFMLVCVGFIFISLLVTGITISLEEKTFIGKIIGFSVMGVLFGIPGLLFFE